MMTMVTQEGAQFCLWLLKVLPTASRTAELKQDHLSSACSTPAQLSSAQLNSMYAWLPQESQAQTYLVDKILPSTSPSSVPAAAEEEAGAEEEAEEATEPDEIEVTADTP